MSKEIEIRYAKARAERGDSRWHWVTECPYCAQAHVHDGGPGDGDPRLFLGSRQPHCAYSADTERLYHMYWLTDQPLSGDIPEALWAYVGLPADHWPVEYQPTGLVVSETARRERG